MASNVMALLKNPFHYMRVLLSIAPEHEERCSRSIPSEQIEESRGYRLAWPIVIG